MPTNNYKYDNETCERILNIHKQGKKNFKQIAAEVNIPAGTIRRICRGLTKSNGRKVMRSTGVQRKCKKEIVEDGIFRHDPYYYVGWNW